MKRVLCWVGHHDWDAHPVFQWPCVRQCPRCLRVEERAFMASRWRVAKHLCGLDETATRALMWRRQVARQLNEQLQRRRDIRAIW